MKLQIDISKFKLKPYAHQLEGVKLLLKHPTFGLFDEPGGMKTKQVVDAACVMRDHGLLDVVVVACPAQVKDVWLDKQFSEVKKHSWGNFTLYNYNSRTEDDLALVSNGLVWIVCSYEFLRQEGPRGYPKVDALKKALKGKKWWLVCDEGSELGNHKSGQVRAVLDLRKKAPRVTVLDGTAPGNNPGCLYTKFKILDWQILGYRSRAEYDSKHAEKGGWQGKAIVGWKDMDVVTQKTAPYCIHRKKRDCIDLPPRLPATFITAPLSEKTWKVYKDLRDQLYAELDRGEVLVQFAATKILRLAQICAGFVGGVEQEGTEETATVELSTESTVAFEQWLIRRLDEDPNFKAIVWCRWRPEIERLRARLINNSLFRLGVMYGGWRDSNFFHPDDPYQGAGVMLCQPQAAKYGLNMSKASHNFWLSYDYDLITRQQAGDRIERAGQLNPMTDTDMVVTGPQGQRTIIHDIRYAIENKLSVSQRIIADWKKVLREDA